jgi:hypothetical protein
MILGDKTLLFQGGSVTIIAVAKAQWALDYEQDNIKLATTLVELRELSLWAPSVLPDPAMPPPPCGAFKAVEDVKAVPIDVEDPTKIVQIGADLNPK